MRKKVILYGTGLALFVGGFAAYSYITGASLFNPLGRPVERQERHPLLSSETDIASPSFETRDADMRLEYVLTAKSAHPLGKGRFDLTEPRITYYNKDGSLVVVTADAGQVSVDEIGGDQSKMQPKSGKLSKNVRLTTGAQDSFVPGNNDLQPHQLQARFGSDIDFSYADHTLESKGTIQVRGELRGNGVSFDGENLTLLFNADDHRIEYLRIDRGDRIVLKNVRLGGDSGGGGGSAGGAGAAGASEPAAPANVAAGPASAPPAAPAPVKKEAAPPATIYRLAFGQDVKAQMGERTLTSDDMFLIFQGGGTDAGGSGEAPSSSVAVAPGAPAAPVAPGASTPPTSPAAIAGATPSSPATPATQDVTITWHGPMEMHPVLDGSVKLNTAKDNIFEASSHQGRPVLMTEGDSRVMRAGHIWYHTASQHLHLDPAELGRVEMTDATLGHLVCQGVDYAEQNLSLILAGPGQLEARAGALREGDEAAPAGGAGDTQADKQPVIAKWTHSLDLTLAQVPDANNPKKTTQVVRRAIFRGDADVRDPTFWIHGDTLDALIARAMVAGAAGGNGEGNGGGGGPKMRQTLEHLLATGAVQAQSYRGGAAGEQNPDIVQGDRLELFTAPGAESKLPAPDRLLVDGHVLAVTHQPDKKDPTRLLQNQIAAPHLAIKLEPKSGAATAKRSAPQSLGGVTVKTLDASGGAEVKLEGYGPQPVLATADTLHADAAAGTAILRGLAAAADAPARPARLERGQDHIIGMNLFLDQKAETVDIPGPGEFVFLQPARQSDVKKEDTPVQVVWQTSMEYDGKNLFADFVGPVRARLLGKPDQDSELTADKLHVRMAAPGAKTAAGVAGGDDTADAGTPRPAEIRAMGHVRVDGATYDAQHNYLTRMLLTDADLLVYSEENKMLVVPGKGRMLMEDRREPPARDPARAAAPGDSGGDASSARGETAFSWAESLSYAGDTGLIHLKKDVVMHHIPLHPIRLGSSAPLAPGKAASPAPAEASSAGKMPPIENIWLKCDDLVATVVSAKNSSSNPVALGANDGSHLTKVVAQALPGQRAVLDMSPVELAAEILDFDAVTNKAIARSRNGRIPAHAESPDWGLLNADEIIWDMTKDPAHRDEAITLIRPRMISAQ